MILELIYPLVLFALTTTITPGGATTLATASGAKFGFRRSMPLMAGISTGLATLASLAAVGLSGILLAVPSLQLALHLIASIYLLWLAYRIATSGSPKLNEELEFPIGFFGAAGLLWVNPKAWAMTTGAAATFASLASHPAHLAMLLGGVFWLAATLSMSIWCTAGLILARLIKTRLQWHIVNASLGVLLVVSIIPMWLK
jgi:threonine/homoserine/homoserine lactone efflux protein